MKRVGIGLVLLLGLTLAGCSTVEKVVGYKMDQRTIGVGMTAWAGIEHSVATYLKLDLCSATVKMPCRTQKLSAQLATDVRLARAAQRAIWADAKANGGAGSTALYTAFNAAVAVVQADLASSGTK